MTKPVFSQKDLLTSGEVGRLLGLSVRSVALWTRAGMLPTLRTPGGHRRYARKDVEDFIASLKAADDQVKPSAPQAEPPQAEPPQAEVPTDGTPGHPPFNLLRHDTSPSFHRLSTTTGVVGMLAGRDDPATVVFEHGGFEYTVTVSRTLLQPVTK